jgi:hypothetical protein
MVDQDWDADMFLSELRDAWTAIHGEEPREPFFVGSLYEYDEPDPNHAAWWLAAKSHLDTAPEFAWILLIRSADPGSAEENADPIMNWSLAQVEEFTEWAAQWPGWESTPLSLNSALGKQIRGWLPYQSEPPSPS